MPAPPSDPEVSTHTVAESVANHLADVLIRAHQIPADVHHIRPGEVTVSVYFGLVARTDGRRIWWLVPDDGARRRPLWTYATTPTAAAARLATHYAQLRQRPIAEIIGALPLLSDLILEQHAPAH